MNYRLLLAALLLTATSGYAQTAPPMPKKMAVIDFDRAVLSNLEGIKARGQLEVRLKYWQEESDKLQAKLKTATDKLAKATTETEKASLRKEIDDTNVAIARNREDANRDIDTRRAALFSGIADRVKNVLKAYGDEQGLAAVFNDTAAAQGSVVYKTDVADITSEIVRRVNADIEKNPVVKVPEPPK